MSLGLPPLIKTFQSCLQCLKKEKENVFCIQNMLFCQVKEHCYRLAWEREACIPEMTSVGREKKELEGGGGAEDCRSSEDKYPSKRREGVSEGGEERKGGEVTEGCNDHRYRERRRRWVYPAQVRGRQATPTFLMFDLKV